MQLYTPRCTLYSLASNNLNASCTLYFEHSCTTMQMYSTVRSSALHLTYIANACVEKKVECKCDVQVTFDGDVWGKSTMLTTLLVFLTLLNFTAGLYFENVTVIFSICILYRRYYIEIFCASDWSASYESSFRDDPSHESSQ